MVAFWFIQVAIELFTYIFEYQSELFIAAIEADKDTILKPINAVGNFVKKVVGKEPEQPKEPKKILKVLDKTIEKIKTRVEIRISKIFLIIKPPVGNFCSPNLLLNL